MTIRQEVKRRAFRAMAGFVCGMVVGGFLVMGSLVRLSQLELSNDPPPGAVVYLLVLTSVLAGWASMLAGQRYASVLGRGVCCGATWIVLGIGRDLDKMKCCPYCGKSLDDELPSTVRHAKSKKKGDLWEDELA